MSIAKRHRFVVLAAAGALAQCLALSAARADVAGVPVLSSRPGDPYTNYLDFAGFSFTGTWNTTTGDTPGTSLSFDGTTSTFNAASQANIETIWSRVAEKYAAWNINVTTVDPAVSGLAAEGLALTDFNRQAYYDEQPDMMHTVIGNTAGTNGANFTAGGGIGLVGTTSRVYATAPQYNGGAGLGKHTNFVFPSKVTRLSSMAEAAAHENGHGFGLEHQSDIAANTNPATTGEYSSNNDAEGNGSFAPIMGACYYAQRGTWRYGNESSSSAFQNDVDVIGGNAGMTLYSDNVGHSVATATPIPMQSGTTKVDASRAVGVITPKSLTTDSPLGVSNYTTDYFSFASDGHASISLTATDGGEYITPGTADPGATLQSTLSILNGSGAVVGTGILATDTLSETFTGRLAAGDYYAVIASNGGYQSTFDSTAQYYSLGSYFLSGSGIVAVPEPLFGVAACAGLLLLRRRAGTSALC